MFEKLFAGSNLLDWPIAAMLFFMVFFGAVVLRVYSKKRKNLYEEMAHLPLEDESLKDGPLAFGGDDTEGRTRQKQDLRETQA